jgi:hypothetical protein
MLAAASAAQQTTTAATSAPAAATAAEGEKPKLNTPLAAMLPPEYADVDVTTIFPEFRPGQVSKALF